jgi:predicted nucleotidyltransferase
MYQNENIIRIKAVYHALEELADSVVFVGGATVSLYSDRAAAETRPTDDVDIVMELAKYTEYADVEEQLRKKGFINDIASGVICRYIIKGVVVDVMPTGENVLGFKNKWYPDGFKYSIKHMIDEQVSVRIFTPAYFIASKLDAYNDRGKEDGRFSKDLEDIVYAPNNRSTIWIEMNDAHEEVRKYLKMAFTNLLEQKYIYDWISSHLEYSEQRRVNFIIGGLQDFTSDNP